MGFKTGEHVCQDTDKHKRQEHLFKVLQNFVENNAKSTMALKGFWKYSFSAVELKNSNLMCYFVSQIWLIWRFVF